MTTITIDLQFQPLHTAEEILNTLCFETVMGLEAHNWQDAYCHIFIPVSKRVIVFAEVQMDNATRKPIYYVTSSKNQSAEIKSLPYNQAVSKLNALLAQ